MFNFILRLFASPLVDTLTKAYKARIEARNDHERIEADKTIAKIEAATYIARADLARKWSATAIGRWLVVVPFGIWWSAIYMVQIINPWFDMDLVVVAVPDNIMEMAKILIPAILIGDAFALTRIKR